MDRVSFVVAGVQKAGTTALDYYLRQHPHLCMGNRKELHFFDNDSFFQEEVDYSKYHNQFSPEPESRLFGEVTPIYIYWKPSMQRIYNYNPKMKVVIVLRNPVDRAFSHWNMEVARGNETRSFINALYHEKELNRHVEAGQHRVYSYVDRGCYAVQLQRLWRFFPQEQTLIIKHEDLVEKATLVMQKVFRFLGVSELESIEEKRVHEGHYMETMSNEAKVFLQGVFLHEIQKVERVLGWDCSAWLKV